MDVGFSAAGLVAIGAAAGVIGVADALAVAGTNGFTLPLILSALSCAFCARSSNFFVISAGVITSSKTFTDRVRNDVIKGDEDTPALLPDPAEWISSTGYNAGTLAGTETLDRDNGENQYGTAAVDFTLAAPTNGSVGKKLILTFTTSAILDLSFSGIEMATAAAALLPITLEANRTYVIRLAYAGDLWTLQEIYGPTLID